MAAPDGLLAPYAELVPRDPRDIVRDLESFFSLLQKWQRVQNLVSRETLKEFWTRHVADSLQVLPLLRPEDGVLLDLGSGGGFPALPLAIAAKGLSRRHILVEPTARKVSFLRTVARELDLTVTVAPVRAEQLSPAALPPAKVITSRALTSLTQLCALAAPFFGPETRAIFHKGREHVEELAEAGAAWRFDVVVVRSATDPGGVLLELRNLGSKSQR